MLNDINFENISDLIQKDLLTEISNVISTENKTVNTIAQDLKNAGHEKLAKRFIKATDLLENKI